MINIYDTVLSQYANSPKMMNLLWRLNLEMDPTQVFDNFYDDVWNIETASSWGLDLWGRIVGVSRIINVPVNPATAFFGFSSTSSPFNQSVFAYSSFESTELTDEQFRLLILMKAFSNINNCSASTINYLLNELFGNFGKCFVTSQGNMQLTYVFEFYLTVLQQTILLQSGVMPKPAGVQPFVLQIIPASTFGFNGSNLQPFNQGVFCEPRISAPVPEPIPPDWVEGPNPVGSLTSGHSGTASSAVKIDGNIYIASSDRIYRVIPGEPVAGWQDLYCYASITDSCEGQPTIVLSQDGSKLFNFTNSSGGTVRNKTTIFDLVTNGVTYSSLWGKYVYYSTKHHVVRTSTEIRLLGIGSGGEASLNYNTGEFMYYYWPDGPEHEFGTDLAFIDEDLTTILSFGLHYSGGGLAFTTAADSYAGWTKSSDKISSWTGSGKGCWLTASRSVASGKIIVLGDATASVKTYSIGFDRVITRLADMNIARANPGICRGTDGLIYVFGGYGSGGTSDRLNSIEVYNPSTNKWRVSHAVLPYPAYNVCAVPCDSGRILVIGGNAATDKTAQLNYFEPSTTSWHDRDLIPA